MSRTTNPLSLQPLRLRTTDILLKQCVQLSPVQQMLNLFVSFKTDVLRTTIRLLFYDIKRYLKISMLLTYHIFPCLTGHLEII